MGCRKENTNAISDTWLVSNRFFLVITLSLILQCFTFGQSYDSLNMLNGYKSKVYYSEGTDKRANQIALRCDKVLAYFKPDLAFEPSVNILILNPADWPKYCAKGAIYGMPHYTGIGTLVVASDDNPFWQSMVPPIDKLPKDLAEKVIKTYTGENGKLTMQPFFDLLAIHELGHSYHNQQAVKMQRKWMGELFPNILLHTYIAENEPELLPALTLFPQIVIAGGTQGFAYTTLSDFEEKYNDIAQKSPRNYGWYQCKLHAFSATIYDKAGKEVVTKLWKMLKSQPAVLDDETFILVLQNKVHQSLADVQLEWNK